jgi:hypothetical protein
LILPGLWLLRHRKEHGHGGPVPRGRIDAE